MFYEHHVKAAAKLQLRWLDRFVHRKWLKRAHLISDDPTEAMACLMSGLVEGQEFGLFLLSTNGIHWMSPRGTTAGIIPGPQIVSQIVEGEYLVWRVRNAAGVINPIRVAPRGTRQFVTLFQGTLDLLINEHLWRRIEEFAERMQALTAAAQKRNAGLA